MDKLSKSIRNLQQHSQVQICFFFGWKCTRKFCKYSYTHLNRFKNSSSSNVIKTIVIKELLESHKENLHEELIDAEKELKESGGKNKKEKSEQQKMKMRSLTVHYHYLLSPNQLHPQYHHYHQIVHSQQTAQREKDEVEGVSRSNSI